MLKGTTLTDTKHRRRSARIKIRYRWFWWFTVVIGNILISYYILQKPAGAVSVSGIELNSIVKIETSNGFGSGFVVGENLVLTAAHVVENVGNPVSVIFEDGRTISGSVVASGFHDFQNYAASGQSTPYDWALVELDEAQDASLILPLGDSYIVEVGEDLWLIGYPGGQEQNTSKGILSGKDDRELRTDAPADPGYSGGPVVSVNQKAAVGVLVSAPVISGETAQSVRNAIPIEVALEACANAGYPLE